jgi:hypothetical protein
MLNVSVDTSFQQLRGLDSLVFTEILRSMGHYFPPSVDTLAVRIRRNINTAGKL